MMERYTKAIDGAISDFKRLFPQCYNFIQQDVDRMRNETFEAVKRYHMDAAVKGGEKVIKDLDRHLNAATEIFDMGQDFLQPHNGRDYKSAASNILIGMLEIAWISEFKKSNLHKKSKPSNADIADFESLFKSKYRDKIPEFIQILRGGKSGLITGRDKRDLSPLINSENEWTGLKQAALVYCEVLMEKSVFMPNVKTKSEPVARIIGNTFIGLGYTYIKNKPGDNAEDYREYFECEIDKIINNK